MLEVGSWTLDVKYYTRKFHKVLKINPCWSVGMLEGWRVLQFVASLFFRIS